MRGLLWTALLLVTVAGVAGCAAGGARRTMSAPTTSAKPSLTSPVLSVESGKTDTVAPVTTRGNTIVDRHPLFSKPREYYTNSGTNKAVKTAAATVIGIPAGIVGEIKQIFVGAPASQPL